MKQFSRKTLVTQLAIAFGAFYGLAGHSAHAQDASPESATPPEVVEKGLQTIVVTAQRRAENKQSIPVSVTALTSEQLTNRNITDLSQMENMSPGFTFGRSGTDARPAMRGVRTENVGINGDTTIGYFVDGVYKSRAQQALASFVDLARVEIQRGPQGTLYGRNTFGGNVSVISNAPVLNKTQFSAAAQVGSFEKMRLEAMANLPLSNTIAARIAVSGDKADGFVKNDFNPAADLFDQDLKYARISLRYKPNDRFDATLRVDTTDQGGNGGSAFGYKQAGTYLDRTSCQQLFNATPYVFNVRPGNRDGVADCTRTAGAGAGTGANAIGSTIDLGVPLYKAGDGYTVDTDYRSFLKLRDKSAALEMAYRFGAVTVKSITGYADFNTERSSDSDMSASTIAIDYQRTKAETISQELQILSESSGPLRYVAGYYYFKDKLRGTFISQQLPRIIRSPALAAPLSLPQNGAGFYDDPHSETESNAIYAQGSWKATEQFTLTAGARRTVDTKSFRFANANAVLPRTGGQPNGTLIAFNTPAPPASAFGSAGTSNCVPARGPGFHCDPADPSILLGATYSDKTFSKSTVRLAADYQLAKHKLLYASYSTGFRSGGFNSGQAVESVRTFLPEEVKAIELGSKNRFFDNLMQLNVAVFSNNYTNLQEQRQVPVGATTISTIFNAAKAKAKGLEAELEWLATDDLVIGGTLSLLDAKYTSFPDAALPFGTSILVTDATATAPTTVNGVVIAPAGQRRVFAPGYKCDLIAGTGGAGQPAAAFGCDLSGKRVPYSARVQGSVYASYDYSLPNGGMLTPMAVVSYSSGYYGQPTNVDLEKQGAYTKVDLKLNWKINNRWSTQVFVDNATDKGTINRFVWGGGGALQVSMAAPRTYGFRVSYKSF